MPRGHFQRLNDLGFAWDPFEGQWDEGLEALREFHQREGHSQSPKSIAKTIFLWDHR